MSGATADLATGESRSTIRSADLLRLRGQAGALDLAASRRATSVLVGGRRSAFRGRGMDFEESRPYRPGDDVRTIDWRVTARRGETHTKVFRPERERPVVLLVDVGSGMAFASRGRFKSVLAAEVAALVAWMALAHGDRVGALVVADRVHREIPPSASPANTLRIFKTLEQLQAHPAAGARSPDPSALDEGLARVAHATRPGTLVFMLADFWRMSAAGESHFAQCARHAEVVCGFVYDPWEHDLPGRGDHAFTDGRSSLVLHADDPRVRAAYRARFDHHLERLRTLCRRSRAHLLPLCTADRPLDALRAGLAVPAADRAGDAVGT